MAKKKRKPAPKGRVNLKHLRQKFMLHYQQGRIQQALAVIAPHINLRPPNGQLLIDATICYVHLHQWQDAVVQGERAIALMPDNIPLLDGLSHSHGVLKNWESAKRFGSRALTLRDAMVPDAPIAGFSRSDAPAGAGRNIIAFSLFGGDSKYCETAVLNCVEQKRLYPDWICRFYVDDTVPQVTLDRISAEGGEVVMIPDSMKNWPGPMWRFAAYDDPDVARVIFRDADSVVFEREVGAVDDWIAQDTDFHIMRDNGSHTELILAGLWGAKKGALPPMKELIAHFLEKPVKDAHFADQYFLRAYVWPYARGNMTHHDSLFGFYGSSPFPEGPIREDTHVGYAEGTPRIAVTSSLPAGTEVEWSVFDKATDPVTEICRYPAKVVNGSVSGNVPASYARKIQAGAYGVKVDPVGG